MAKPLLSTSAVAGRAAALLRVRWFVRAPVWAYRARLGFVFGSRLLMLEHTGRKTGGRRHAVLEVVGRIGPGGHVVASGFGERAQWFRNIRAEPRVRVYLGGHRPVAATARVLGHGEAARVLATYASAHPRAWAAFAPVLEHTLQAPLSGDETALPLVVLDVTAISPGALENHHHGDRGRASHSHGGPKRVPDRRRRF
jgi:deazaflavin-dependent oxidoreductase (nitroreductase family)